MRKDARKEAISTFVLPPKPHIVPLTHTFALATDLDIQTYYGRLFGFCIIPNHSEESGIIAQRLIDSIQNYYLKQVRLSQTQSLTNDVEQLFEKALAQTNEEIKQFSFDASYKSILKELQAFVGLLKGEKLIMSTIGPMKGFLIRDTKPFVKRQSRSHLPREQEYDEDQYKIISIIESESDFLAGKFSSIITGDIHLGDKLFFCNPELLSYFSLDYIKKHIVLLPGDSAFQQFKNELAHTSLQHHLTGIIINTEKQYNKIRKGSVGSTSESMHALQETLHQTKQVLFPSLSFSQLKKATSSFMTKLKESNTYSAKESISTLNISHDMHSGTKRNRFRLPVLSSSSFGQPLKKGVTQLRNVWSTISHIPLLEKITPPVKKVATNKYVWLGLSVVVLAFFVFSIFYEKEQVAISQVQDYSPLLEQVQQSINVAQSRIIYGDEEKAREALAEVKSKLESIPSEAMTDNTVYLSARQEYQMLYDKLNHVISVDNPVSLVDFQAGFPQQPFSMTSITSLEDVIYAFTCHDIYTASKDSSTPPQRLFTDATFCIKLAKPYKNNLLLLGTDNSFALFDVKTKKLTKLQADIDHTENIVDFYPFGSYLYYIDINSNQIYKNYISANSISSKQKWLKKEYTLALTNSLAIDGSIYVLSEDATIDMYYLGNKKSEFHFGNTQEPPLTHPQQLLTSEEEEYPYLFVLEPQTQRLVMIEKEDGNFSSQITFPSLKDVQDFTIDFELKKIYLLQNNIIYSFDLPT